jgi:hypothetical protein
MAHGMGKRINIEHAVGFDAYSLAVPDVHVDICMYACNIEERVQPHMMIIVLRIKVQVSNKEKYIPISTGDQAGLYQILSYIVLVPIYSMSMMMMMMITN